MKIGDLDTRVQLWAPSSTVDAFGQPIVSFTKTAEVWAHRRDKAGAEVVVTTNPGCLLQIQSGLKKAGADHVRAVHIADYLRENGE